MTRRGSADRPLYRQVADDLREQIAARELRPGRQLPTEAELMERHGVSRNTVRLALGVLRNEGLVVTGQGRGSFVADADAPRPRELLVVSEQVRYPRADALLGELATPSGDERIDVRVATGPASAGVADRLRLHVGASVVVRHRLRYRDMAPSLATDSYVSAEVARDSALADPEPLSTGVAGLLDALGHPVTRVADEVGVRMPSPTEAQELQIASGVPLLTVDRTAFDGDDTPVLAVTALLPGDRHVLRYDAVVDLVDGELATSEV